VVRAPVLPRADHRVEDREQLAWLAALVPTVAGDLVPRLAVPPVAFVILDTHFRSFRGDLWQSLS
jgi:hypothetical protein